MAEQEAVEFRVMSKRYSIQVEGEKKGFDNFGVLNTIPARIVSFDNGSLKTADPVVIASIRRSQDYQIKKIVEVTEADRDVYRMKPEQGVVRGPISTASMEKEAGVKKEEKKSTLSATTACKVCGKEFKDDLGGKRVRLHEISHRRGQPQGVAVEEK